MKRPVSAVCLAVSLLASVVPAQASWVWWEAEKPQRSDFPQKSAFDPVNAREKDVLSAGAWLTWDAQAAQAKPGVTPAAEYSIRVAKSGRYKLWVRKFGEHGLFRWRFNSQAWRE